MANYNIKLALGNATIAARLQLAAKLISGWAASKLPNNSAQAAAIQVVR